MVLQGSRGDDQVAIKFYAKELFDDSGAEEERIRRQVEARHHQHDNLVRTISAGVCPDHGYHYLIMEFIGDPTLTERISEFSNDQIRHIIRQTAQAAFFMHHTMEQVHRDIKPDNIAVNRETDHVTLIDLGLVRPVIGTTVTDQVSQHIKGTKKYAPPELLNNKVELDHEGWRAVTFYQLGATLYEMLTGKQPFAGFEGDELIQAIKGLPLTIEDTSAPSDLVKLALDCLSKDPLTRLSNVEWHQFWASPKQSDDVEDLTDLISSLAAPAEATQVFPDGARDMQRMKKAIADISAQVELAIRAFLSGKEKYFPEFTIHPVDHFGDQNNDGFRFRIVTTFAGPQQRSAYSTLTVAVIESSSRVCQCGLYTSADSQQDFDAVEYRKIYEGVFVAGEFKTKVSTALAQDFKQILSEPYEQ
ncbi:MAG: protein kinase [Pirellulaceae bacterium]